MKKAPRKGLPSQGARKFVGLAYRTASMASSVTRTLLISLAYGSSPKICSCLLLATNTWPSATTGIRLESPPDSARCPLEI